MPFELSIIEAIARKHGLGGKPSLLPASGMVNEAWAIGDDFILRITREEECDDEAKREAAVVPLAIQAGIRTPELIAVSYEKDIVDRPYTVYRRAAGVLLGALDDDPAVYLETYRELGREIAPLQNAKVPDEALPLLSKSGSRGPRVVLDAALESGNLAPEHHAEMLDWLETIEPRLGDTTEVLTHVDIHPWNLMVDPDTRELTAIIDWGDSGMRDPSVEFTSMPLVAVPPMLQGYKEAGGHVDDAFIARAMYRGVGLAGWEIQEGDMVNYRRQWWRMPVGGWPDIKRFLREHYPQFAYEK